jgi:hypothetical protein
VSYVLRRSAYHPEQSENVSARSYQFRFFNKKRRRSPENQRAEIR